MRRLAPQFATITVATVLVLAGATTSGGQAPSAGGAHLMTVPTTPEATAALERSTARVVARYAAFTLVEATGGDVDRLRRAGADRRDDMREVRLARGTIDPNRERRSLAGKGRAARGGPPLGQFVGPVKERWLELLRGAGVRVVGYQAQNAYLVHGGARELDAVAELVGSDPAVRAAVPVQPADKAEGNVLEPGPRRVAIQTIAGDVGAEARERADGAGRTLRGESGVPGLRTQYLEIDGSEAAALARDAGVVAIEPYVEPRLLDERAAQIVAA